jgi:acyl-CoA synthetase (AMP-forming)/AMP-acid ligase II
VAEVCNLNIVKSPYPDIPSGPYRPLYEFVSENWNNNLHKLAIVDGSTGLERTFSDYQRDTNRIAAYLLNNYQIKEDSTIALYCPNHVDYLAVTLAVSLTGAKLTPINPLYTHQELAVVLQRSHSSVLMVHESKLQVALETISDCPSVKHVVVITDYNHIVPDGTVSLESLKKHDSAVKETVHAIHAKTETHPFLLPYSSGTTGIPKGVCLTHANLVANLLQCSVVEDLGFSPHHKLISPLPMFHIYCFTVGLLYCAWKGHAMITMTQRFDLTDFCQLLEKYKPERAHLVPPIVLGLGELQWIVLDSGEKIKNLLTCSTCRNLSAKSPVVDQYDCSSLRQIISAAAPLGQDVEEMAESRLPNCQIKQAWGMSELSPIGTLNSDYNAKRGSVGPLVSSTFAKIVDTEGKSLPAHHDGELLIKGPQLMMGYLDDVEKTQECLSSTKWLRTGDVAHYDDDGYFYITDRLKELIKCRGYAVAPAELEALILTHHDVQDVAVIGIPDDESGELPHAFVVLQEHSTCSEQEIQEWVKERVAPHKRLSGGVTFTGVIPKSASGKILRRILRKEVSPVD